MKEIFNTLKNVFNKIHEVLTSIINFIFIIPIYLIGAGLSRLFYKPKDEKGAASYWKKPDISYKKEDFRRLY